MTKISGIEGKHILVSGAAGLLASGVCHALLQNEAKLTLLDTAADRLKKLADTLSKEYGPKVHLADTTDLLDVTQVNAMLDKSESILGPLHVLIHAAYPRTPDWHLKLEQIPLESWQKNIDMHLNGTFALSQHLGKRMAKRGSGNIILFSSIYGLVGPDFNVYEGLDHMTMPAAYAAIKGGISNYVRYLASYWGRSGVRVNAVCPGGIYDQQASSFVENYNARVPIGRMGKKEEVVGPVLFLASDLSSYVTGINLAVDGGWTAI